MTTSIAGSVGSKAANQTKDVEALQAALSAVAKLTNDPSLDPGRVDGKGGVGTEGAIERFQRRLGFRKPDARVDPGGYTLKRLNALLAIGSVEMFYPFSRRSKFAFFGPEAGMRSFGARRSNGERAHAGIDLYFPDFTSVRSLADGKVVRGPYSFYLKTLAVEIDHGPFVARYGEIAPEKSPTLQEGETVKRGQKIGRIGILTKANGSRLGVASMMLHLEMYDKTETGPLSRAKGTSARDPHGVAYKRRRDLIDPSGFIHRAPLPR